LTVSGVYLGIGSPRSIGDPHHLRAKGTKKKPFGKERVISGKVKKTMWGASSPLGGGGGKDWGRGYQGIELGYEKSCIEREAKELSAKRRKINNITPGEEI